MTTGFTVAVHMEKAQRALVAARLLLRSGDTEGVCNRAYYAMFDAAHAALIAEGDEVPKVPFKTHRTLIAEFGKKLVLGGRMDVAFGRSLNTIQDMRLLADYSSDSPSLEDAKRAVQQAEDFVEGVQKLVANAKA